ncbi:hypothetical protein YT1_4865 [Rhodococcus ruber]|nr:hypothetical protein YT1_4865 [Rhodococcus ruber]
MAHSRYRLRAVAAPGFRRRPSRHRPAGRPNVTSHRCRGLLQNRGSAPSCHGGADLRFRVESVGGQRISTRRS